MISSAKVIYENNSRFGSNVFPYVIPGDQSIDIDTRVDWSIAEFLLEQRSIAFIVTGNDRIGMGHIYNMLNLAAYFASYRILFVGYDISNTGRRIIESHNYEYVEYESFLVNKNGRYFSGILVDILKYSGHILDTLKVLSKNILLFEAEDIGNVQAPLIINAIYSKSAFPEFNNELRGIEYYVLPAFYIS